MRKRWALGLVAAMLVIAAVACGIASATTVRVGSVTGPAYSGAINGTNVGNVVIAPSSGFGTVTCTDAALAGSIASAGSIAISGATWSDAGGPCTNNLGQTCTYTAENLPWGGTLSYNGGSPDGFWTIGGTPYLGFETVCGSVACYYGATAVTWDFQNPSGSTGSEVRGNMTLSKQPGSPFSCGTTVTWVATYSLTENGRADLYVTP